MFTNPTIAPSLASFAHHYVITADGMQHSSATYGCSWPSTFSICCNFWISQVDRTHSVRIVLGGMETQLRYLAEWTGIIHSVACYVPRMCRPPLLLESKQTC
jgi:hypothetical protein